MVEHGRMKKRLSRNVGYIIKKYRSISTNTPWILHRRVKVTCMCSEMVYGVLMLCNSHVLCNGSVADGMRSCRDAGLAAVAAAAAVEAGHVHTVQVIVILSASRGHGLLLTVLIRPVRTNTHNIQITVSLNKPRIN